MDEITLKANMAMAWHYDGSDDWWHAVSVDGVMWDINVWDACVYGDEERSGLQMTAYPLTADGTTDTMKYIQLEISSITMKISQLKQKVKELV
jgi:hypothetical protein